MSILGGAKEMFSGGSRTVYHVLYNKSGGYWYVKKEGGFVDEMLKSSTKKDAVRKAKARADDERPSQVKIHNKNGRIGREVTYGSDPERFEG